MARTFGVEVRQAAGGCTARAGRRAAAASGASRRRSRRTAPGRVRSQCPAWPVELGRERRASALDRGQDLSRPPAAPDVMSTAADGTASRARAARPGRTPPRPAAGGLRPGVRGCAPPRSRRDNDAVGFDGAHGTRAAGIENVGHDLRSMKQHPATVQERRGQRPGLKAANLIVNGGGRPGEIQPAFSALEALGRTSRAVRPAAFPRAALPPSVSSSPRAALPRLKPAAPRARRSSRQDRCRPIRRQASDPRRGRDDPHDGHAGLGDRPRGWRDGLAPRRAIGEAATRER